MARKKQAKKAKSQKNLSKTKMKAYALDKDLAYKLKESFLKSVYNNQLEYIQTFMSLLHSEDFALLKNIWGENSYAGILSDIGHKSPISKLVYHAKTYYSGGKKKAFQFLMASYGKEICQQDSFLYYLANNLDDKDTASFLVKNFKMIDSASGKNLLHLAIDADNMDLIKAIIGFNELRSEQDFQGNTPYEHALGNLKDEIISRIGQADYQDSNVMKSAISKLNRGRDFKISVDIIKSFCLATGIKYKKNVLAEELIKVKPLPPAPPKSTKPIDDAADLLLMTMKYHYIKSVLQSKPSLSKSDAQKLLAKYYQIPREEILNKYLTDLAEYSNSEKIAMQDMLILELPLKFFRVSGLEGTFENFMSLMPKGVNISNTQKFIILTNLTHVNYWSKKLLLALDCAQDAFNISPEVFSRREYTTESNHLTKVYKSLLETFVTLKVQNPNLVSTLRQEDNGHYQDDISSSMQEIIRITQNSSHKIFIQSKLLLYYLKSFTVFEANIKELISSIESPALKIFCQNLVEQYFNGSIKSGNFEILFHQDAIEWLRDIEDILGISVNQEEITAIDGLLSSIRAYFGEDYGFYELSLNPALERKNIFDIIRISSKIDKQSLHQMALEYIIKHEKIFLKANPKSVVIITKAYLQYMTDNSTASYNTLKALESTEVSTLPNSMKSVYCAILTWLVDDIPAEIANIYVKIAAILPYYASLVGIKRKIDLIEATNKQTKLELVIDDLDKSKSSSIELDNVSVKQLSKTEVMSLSPDDFDYHFQQGEISKGLAKSYHKKFFAQKDRLSLQQKIATKIGSDDAEITKQASWLFKDEIFSSQDADIEPIEWLDNHWAIIDRSLLSGLDKAKQIAFSHNLSKKAKANHSSNGIKYTEQGLGFKIKINADDRIYATCKLKNSHGEYLIYFEKLGGHNEVSKLKAKRSALGDDVVIEGDGLAVIDVETAATILHEFDASGTDSKTAQQQVSVQQHYQLADLFSGVGSIDDSDTSFITGFATDMDQGKFYI